PARELAQLSPGRVHPRPDFRPWLTAVREQLRHMSEPPLGTVAELALKPAALLIRRLDNPAPGRLQFANACAHLSLKPRVRKPRAGQQSRPPTAEQGRRGQPGHAPRPRRAGIPHLTAHTLVQYLRHVVFAYSAH